MVKEDNVFVGAGTSWFDPDHWSLGYIPSPCNHVIIPSGKEVSIHQIGAHCYTLEVNGSINTSVATTLDVQAANSE